MKVYRVYVDKYWWDEYDAIVVVAENADNALVVMQSGCYGHGYFNEHQGEVHVEEVDLTTEHIVLESFNAG